ncbi:MAG: hypothetical protein ACTSQJ_03840 [Promethearchaeota archaeon]
MHFLIKIIQNPELEDPFNNHLSVHRHFYRYSKGEFLGPALKISKTKSRITLKGTIEYEDLIIEIVSKTLLTENIEIKGVLITGQDITKIITELGLNWKLKKSTGKAKNYKADIADIIKKSVLLNSIEKFRENSYYLISFNANNTCKVTTKRRLPQPSKKRIDEDDLNKRIQFCSGIINNSKNNIELVLDSALPDFKQTIPKDWKTITITNNYKIENLLLPENINNWGLKRIMAIRKGILVRTVNIDEDLIEKQYKITV